MFHAFILVLLFFFLLETNEIFYTGYLSLVKIIMYNEFTYSFNCSMSTKITIQDLNGNESKSGKLTITF